MAFLINFNPMLFGQDDLENSVQINLPNGGHDDVVISYSDQTTTYSVEIPASTYLPGMVALASSRSVKYVSSDEKHIIIKTWAGLPKDQTESGQNEAKSDQIEPKPPEIIVI